MPYKKAIAAFFLYKQGIIEISSCSKGSFFWFEFTDTKQDLFKKP